MAFKRKKTNYYKSKGMPIGASHKWIYTEKKYTSKGNNFKIEQSKGRSHSSPHGSGMPLRSKLIWKIKGKEKIGKARKIRGYGTVTPVIITGIKTQRGYKLPIMKKFKISKRKKYLNRRSKW